jgi:hypothetical protein
MWNSMAAPPKLQPTERSLGGQSPRRIFNRQLFEHITGFKLRERCGEIIRKGFKKSLLGGVPQILGFCEPDQNENTSLNLVLRW